MSHTPQKFQAIHVSSQKVKKPPYGSFTRLLFASGIILIFGSFFYIESLYSQIQAQLAKGTNNLFLKEKNLNPEG